MTRTQAKNRFIAYLRDNNISYTESICNGDYCLTMLFTGYDNCPDNVLEGCIYFYEDCLEARVYFDENAAGWIKKRADSLTGIYRLLNFINARLWPSHQSDLYKNQLFMPRIYITEDGCYDLTATIFIDYDVFEMAPLETEDFITAALPGLIDDLSLPMFSVILEERTPDQAITYIEENILQ